MISNKELIHVKCTCTMHTYLTRHAIAERERYFSESSPIFSNVPSMPWSLINSVGKFNINNLCYIERNIGTPIPSFSLKYFRLNAESSMSSNSSCKTIPSVRSKRVFGIIMCWGSKLFKSIKVLEYVWLSANWYNKISAFIKFMVAIPIIPLFLYSVTETNTIFFGICEDGVLSTLGVPTGFKREFPAVRFLFLLSKTLFELGVLDPGVCFQLLLSVVGVETTDMS